MGISLLKNSNVTSVCYSCKSSWVTSNRNNFLIMLFWLPTLEPCSAQEQLRHPNLRLVQTLSNFMIIMSFKHKIMACSGCKMIIFQHHTNFYWQSAQNKADIKLKMSNFYLVTAVLHSAIERLDLPTEWIPSTKTACHMFIRSQWIPLISKKQL